MAISIELDDQQALAFRLLAQAGAWDLRKGSVTIHFDKEGNPTTAEVRSFTYSEVIHSIDDNIRISC